MKSVEENILIENTIRDEANLPAQVFNDQYSTFLFFDNDICSSDDLINAVKNIISHSFDDDTVAVVYSSNDFSFLVELR